MKNHYGGCEQHVKTIAGYGNSLYTEAIYQLISPPPHFPDVNTLP